ncbi:hypothetical protein PYCC9005_004423 [Savitreella phatthalungensis]
MLRLSSRAVIFGVIVTLLLTLSFIYRDEARKGAEDLSSTLRHEAPARVTVTVTAPMNPALATAAVAATGDISAVLAKQQQELDRVAALLDRMTRIVELRDANRFDDRIKNSITRNIDYLHSVDHEEFWADAPYSVWDLKRREWHNWVNNTAPKWSEERSKHNGRGIVFVGGNDATVALVKVTVSMLRAYGCSLPMELHYLEGELDEEKLKLFGSLKVKTRNLGDKSNLFPVIKQPGKGGKSFHIKTAAIANSAFAEVIYLDSDSMPTRDPQFLFESASYQRTGILLWPDFWKTHHTNPIWHIFDTPLRDEWEAESGQVVIDKTRNWDVLMLAHFINADGAFYYQLLNGDKDSIRFAAKGLRREYSMSSQFLAAGGYIYMDRFCGHTMVQFNPETKDEVLFVHANLLKEHPHSELNTDGEGSDLGVFPVFKGYLATEDNTWLRPRFITPGGRPCMELEVGKGEPDIREVPFDEAVPGWNAFYKKHGGVGGGQ